LVTSTKSSSLSSLAAFVSVSSFSSMFKETVLAFLARGFAAGLLDAGFASAED
jgi:hypothetical protein